MKFKPVVTVTDFTPVGTLAEQNLQDFLIEVQFVFDRNFPVYPLLIAIVAQNR